MTRNLTARRAAARAGAVLLCGAVAVGATALPAAADDDDVRRSSACGSGVLKLKLSEEDGRIETELEVDTNRNGQTWVVKLFHDGRRVARTTGVTAGRSGSFEIERLIANGPGQDRVRGVAKRNGTRCSVSAVF
jgi:hypothetical protein